VWKFTDKSVVAQLVSKSPNPPLIESEDVLTYSQETGRCPELHESSPHLPTKISILILSSHLSIHRYVNMFLPLMFSYLHTFIVCVDEQC
jgi:hypothetical protein